ncbi:hypothetical protein JW721_05255 [Candidatus Micrarchaeota archaeon]|nr:hypothetical protein [Candidatus Micrarchaeota archaeon]
MSLRKFVEFVLLIGIVVLVQPLIGFAFAQQYDLAIIWGVAFLFCLVTFMVLYLQDKQDHAEEGYSPYVNTRIKKTQKTKKLLSSLGELCVLDPGLSIRSNEEKILLEKDSPVSKTRLVYSADVGTVISNRYSVSGWGWAILILLFPLSLLFYVWHSNEEKTRLRELLSECL